MQPAGAKDITARSWRRGDEPIAGYRLIVRLGGGGAGEVWKAQSPGGFTVALKFVPLAAKMGEAELRSLEVLKNIRHPNLLAIFGAWHQQNLLILAMELADKTLHDRHREEVEQGRPGIPRAELLEYIQEAAKGIDYLNNPGHSVGGKEKVSVQHRDIKPQNILLLGNGIKVGDFGLVKVLERNVTSNTGMLTIAYAAPELLQGLTSYRSDQYSLAASYCFLRTGRTPFSGSMAQIYAAQLSRAPDLSMLAEAERPILRRALALNPEDRWPSCRAFVSELAAVEPDHKGHSNVSPSGPKATSAPYQATEDSRSPANTFPLDHPSPADFATRPSKALSKPAAGAATVPQPAGQRASGWQGAAATGKTSGPSKTGSSSAGLGIRLAGWWRAYRILILAFALTATVMLLYFIFVEKLWEKQPSMPPKQETPVVPHDDDGLDDARIDSPAGTICAYRRERPPSIELGLPYNSMATALCSAKIDQSIRQVWASAWRGRGVLSA